MTEEISGVFKLPQEVVSSILDVGFMRTTAELLTINASGDADRTQALLLGIIIELSNQNPDFEVEEVFKFWKEAYARYQVSEAVMQSTGETKQ